MLLYQDFIDRFNVGAIGGVDAVPHHVCNGADAMHFSRLNRQARRSVNNRYFIINQQFNRPGSQDRQVVELVLVLYAQVARRNARLLGVHT